jgi:predicted enzyme related to lactoylglutathione lyase
MAGSHDSALLSVALYGWRGREVSWCEDEGMHIELTLDCVDLDAVAAFWRAALGYAAVGTIGRRYVALTGDGPGLTLQRVPEPKQGKNRMHLDLLVDDVDAEVARLCALGATMVTPVAREQFGQRWFVLADVEGNEFCVAKGPSDDSRVTDGGAKPGQRA